MTRYSYIGLLVGGVAIVALALIYNTPSSDHAEFAGVSLRIEYATTTEARERGLSGVSYIPEDYGMLFVFPRDGVYGFWMKDMQASIDIFWLDDKGQVIFLQPNVEPSSYPYVFYPSEPARYVLETRAGFSTRHSVSVGAKLVLPNWPRVSK